MRIAIMAINFAPGQPNSHEAHLPQLVSAMVGMDYKNSYILLLRSDNRDCFPSPSQRVTHIVFPSLCRYKLFQIICEQVVVPLILVLCRADVLHFPTNIRPVLIPCKSVGTVHWVVTPLLEKDYPWHKRVYLSVLGRVSLSKADRLIAVSSSCKADLVSGERIPAEKIEVIHHGISENFSPREASPAIMAKYGLRQGYLLYIGTSASYKNLVNLLEAYAYARAKHRITNQLVLAGNIDRELVIELANRCEVLLGDSDWIADIVCTGYIPYRIVPLLYAGASLVISVSLQETFGVILLEAMASGVPAIVSNIPAFVETAGGAALIVNPRDPVEIADSIGQIVLKPGFAQQLARKGLARAGEFSWDRAARETLRVYEAAICNAKKNEA